MAEISLRIDLGEDRRFGPGKARLLELIRDTGSISAAGRALGMSYRRAWLLTDQLNQMFGAQLVAPQHGGAKGGGRKTASKTTRKSTAKKAVRKTAGKRSSK